MDATGLATLAEAILPLADRYVQLQEKKFDHYRDTSNQESIHQRRLTLYLILFAGAIIAAMAILTFFQRVSGDGLMFLTGIVVGSILSMIYRQMFGDTTYTDGEQEA